MPFSRKKLGEGVSETELRLKYNEELQDLRTQLRAKDALLKDYRSSHGSLVNLFNEMRDAVIVYAKAPVEYKPPRSKTKVTSPCSVCLLICDSHYGAVQSKSEVEGFGEYSPEISERRQMEFVHRVVAWVELHRATYKVAEARVLVVGDLISGDIHRELSVTNAFPVPIQVAGSARILASQIQFLSRYFEKVTVEFLTEDNHSRLTKKPQAKEAGYNSFNYLVGAIAQLHLSQQPNVTFNIYPQHEVVVNLCGRRYLLMHGHNVKGWMGFPYYGVERKIAREAVKRMNTPDPTKFHKVVMGHWHSPLAHPLYWIGGSASGTDAYDHKNGRHAAPSQAAWFIHPRYGEFDRTDFILSL